MTLVASAAPKRARDRNFFIVFLLSKITIPFGAKELTLDPFILGLCEIFQLDHARVRDFGKRLKRVSD